VALNLITIFKSFAMNKSTLIIFILTTFFFLNSYSQPIVSFSQITGLSLTNPLDVVTANDGTNRIFIAERAGVIKLYSSSYALLNSNFLTINTNFTSGGERGLLSVAFHPDYENNRYFFVYYTNGTGGVNIDRFQTLATNPNQADATTRTNILTIPKPVVYSNHNGGKLNFGADGNLYVGLGDSGSFNDPGNLAQNGNSLWGKMLRINVDNFTTAPFYTIPATNPFVSDANVLDEIFSLGLRNPWRWSFDKLTGNIWIADVGQDAKEEVNKLTVAQASGANYGWKCYEGLDLYLNAGCLPQNNYTAPIFDYPHNPSNGGYSITGGMVYRGTVFPAFYGYYICSDYVTGNVWVINASNNAVAFQSNVLTSISSFGELENGEMLALTLNGGLYRVTTSSVVSLKLLNWFGNSYENYNQLQWQTTEEKEVKNFEVEYSIDGNTFLTAGIITAKNELRSAYMFKHLSQNTQIYYRLKTTQINGSVEYSKIISLKKDASKKEQYIFNYNNNGRLIWLNILANERASFQLYDFNGQNILNVENYSNNKIIDLQKLATGIYIGKIILKDKMVTEKIVIR
jgi:glucose/arabinose dehydrogenase